VVFLFVFNFSISHFLLLLLLLLHLVLSLTMSREGSSPLFSRIQHDPSLPDSFEYLVNPAKLDVKAGFPPMNLFFNGI